MAKKKETEKKKVILEREYNVPLRKEFLKVQNNRKAKKAINALRQFIQKHMKSEQVKIGDMINKEVWAKGIRNPPHHVKVKASKYEDGTVFVESIKAPAEKQEEKKAKKGAKEKETKAETKKEAKDSEEAAPEASKKPETKKEEPKAKAAKASDN